MYDNKEFFRQLHEGNYLLCIYNKNPLQQVLGHQFKMLNSVCSEYLQSVILAVQLTDRFIVKLAKMDKIQIMELEDGTNRMVSIILLDNAILENEFRKFIKENLKLN